MPSENTIKKPLSELVQDTDTCKEICELSGCSGFHNAQLIPPNGVCLNFYDGCSLYIYDNGEMGFEDQAFDTVNIANCIKISKLLDSKYIFIDEA